VGNRESSKKIKIGEEKWRIVRVYANGYVREKWEGIREWVEDKDDRGGDFNARTGEQERRSERGMEGEEEGKI